MESNSSSAVHSNAFNFGEFVSGGVDHGYVHLRLFVGKAALGGSQWS